MSGLPAQGRVGRLSASSEAFQRQGGEKTARWVGIAGPLSQTLFL